MEKPTSIFTPVLIAGCVIILVSIAIRAAFGVFQIPIAEEFGWLRSEFSLAIAIQNLFWGIGQPIFGAIAEKIGDRKAILMGAIFIRTWSCSFVFCRDTGGASVLRNFSWVRHSRHRVWCNSGGGWPSQQCRNRSMSLAIAAATGSGGQIVGPPLAEFLLRVMSWQSVFLVFAAAILSVILILPMMRAPVSADKAELEESLGAILGKAFRDPSYTLIFLGFFSCGYQVAFITAHFPAFVAEMCGPIMPGGTLDAMGISTTSALGAVAISVIGLANIAGTLTAGWLGKRYSKKYLLAGIYAGRTFIAAAFIMTPITPETVLLFSALMGALWLATIPLTSGLIAHIYGVRYMGTLYGIVFFSHQLGSFLGVWLGGEMYDLYGSYTLVWWIGVGIGAFSAIVHLPVRERALNPV